MSKTSLILISDNPNGRTGLGRVTAEIAQRIHAFMGDDLRIGVVGIGGPAYNKFDFPVWRVALNPDYSISDLPDIAEVFSPGKTPILMTIENSGWLRWLAFPEALPRDSGLRIWLEEKKPKVWAYLPIDGEGPNGKLANSDKKVIEQFHRILAYTKFGAQVLDRTLLHPATINPEKPTTEWLPHGTDTTVFYPRDKVRARNKEFGPRVAKQEIGIGNGTFMVGIVATNTARKDWALAMETCAELKARGEDIGIWAHTDRLNGYWDLLTLAFDFGIHEQVLFTYGDLSNEDMAWGYSACDVILGIGPEGWGMPLAEAMACGTPVVTGDYAGATEFVPADSRVPPFAFRYDGVFSAQRPVYQFKAWANYVQNVKGKTLCLPSEFSWTEAWPRWEQWIRKGLK